MRTLVSMGDVEECHTGGGSSRSRRQPAARAPIRGGASRTKKPDLVEEPEDSPVSDDGDSEYEDESSEESDSESDEYDEDEAPFYTALEELESSGYDRDTGAGLEEALESVGSGEFENIIDTMKDVIKDKTENQAELKQLKKILDNSYKRILAEQRAAAKQARSSRSPKRLVSRSPAAARAVIEAEEESADEDTDGEELQECMTAGSSGTNPITISSEEESGEESEESEESEEASGSEEEESDGETEASEDDQSGEESEEE